MRAFDHPPDQTQVISSIKSLRTLAAITAACCCLAASTAASEAAVISVNLSNAGSSTERGVAFDLKNNSATETVELTGVIQLAVTSSASETYSLYTRDGTVVGNIGAGATNWTTRGTATATGQAYASPSFNLTTLSFASAANLQIAPGATLGIWLKDSDASASVRYINGGSGTVDSTTGFAPGGKLTYTGYVGLGPTGSSPTVTNSTFGPTRNFIGTVEYTVVPEPGTLGLAMAATMLLARRRRR